MDEQQIVQAAQLLVPSELRRLREAYNPDQPRDPDGRFASGGGGSSSGSSSSGSGSGNSSGSWEKAAADVIAHGGGTFDPKTGESPKTGYQVAQTGATTQHPEAILSDPKALASAMLDFRQANGAAFKADPDIKVGVWVQGGKVWMEPSENIGDRDQAVQAGRDRDQIAIWDNAAGKEIPTGGSGGI